MDEMIQLAYPCIFSIKQMHYDLLMLAVRPVNFCSITVL